MKITPSRLTLSVACLLAAASALNAAPLKRGDIPADPTWVLHLDMDNLKATTIGGFLNEQISAKPEAQAKLAAFQAIVGFDLQKQLHGITLYGTSSKPEDGVLIVYSDFDAERLLILARAADGYKAEDYNKHVIHHWIDRMKPAKDGATNLTYATIAGSRVLFSQKRETMTTAIDAIDGKKNLAATQNFPLLGVNSGMIQAAARHLDLPESDPNAAMFRLSQTIGMELTESDHVMKMGMSFRAKDSETGKRLADIGRGLVALGLIQDKNAGLTKLANATTIKQDGAEVDVSLSVPAADLIAFLKTQGH